MSLPKVSVIIPSYNHAQYILRAINSVLNQTYKNCELIIIDDGSTDNTHELVTEIKKINPSRIIKYFLNKKNMGLTYSWNRGMQKAKGELVCVLDSDDYLPSDSIEKRINIIDHADAVITDMKIIQPDKTELLLEQIPTDKNDIFKFISSPNPKGNINTNTLLMRKNVFKKIGFRS